MKLVFFGPPGVGKGTYAEEFKKFMDIVHISTGDLLRDEVRNATSLGKTVKKYLDNGKLIPNKLMLKLVHNSIKGLGAFIIEGTPRTVEQAEDLDKYVGIDCAVEFHAPDDVIIERLSGRRVCPKCHEIYHLIYKPPKKPGVCDKCGSALIHRHDDTPEVIKDRLIIYHEYTEPLKKYYGDRLVRVTAVGLIPEIAKEAFDRVSQRCGL